MYKEEKLEKELKESRENNNLLEKELEESKEMLEDSKKKLKSTRNMLSQCRDQQSLTVKKKASAVGDLVSLFQDIDKIFSMNYPGKHTQTRAKLFLDALSSKLLFHGEAIALLDEMK